jgi:hypothetical protein
MEFWPGVVLWIDSTRSDGLGCLMATNGDTYLFRNFHSDAVTYLNVDTFPAGFKPEPNSLVKFALHWFVGRNQTQQYAVDFVGAYPDCPEEDRIALDAALKVYHQTARKKQKDRREARKEQLIGEMGPEKYLESCRTRAQARGHKWN